MSRTNIGTGLAAKGYDVVAYFSDAATPGDPAITATHEGATYYFTSEENKARFESDPARYAPAFGGWCAYAMSESKLFDVDPRSFKIVDGRLMLFYDGVGGNTREIWESGEVSQAQRLQRAAERWDQELAAAQ